MCNHYELVKVKIPVDLSCTNKEHWKECKIDGCIAKIVRALQEGGIDMRSSCCGHGYNGDIQLQDGRALIIISKDKANKYYVSKRKR